MSPIMNPHLPHEGTQVPGIIHAVAFAVETVHTRYQFIARGEMAKTCEQRLRQAFAMTDPAAYFELVISEDDPDVMGIPFMVRGSAITALEIRRIRLLSRGGESRLRDVGVSFEQVFRGPR